MQDITVGSRVRIINDDGIPFSCVGKITTVLEIEYNAKDECFYYLCGSDSRNVRVGFTRDQLELVQA